MRVQKAKGQSHGRQTSLTPSDVRTHLWTAELHTWSEKYSQKVELLIFVPAGDSNRNF